MWNQFVQLFLGSVSEFLAILYEKTEQSTPLKEAKSIENPGFDHPKIGASGVPQRQGEGLKNQ
jgi:hypothetical protein